MKKLITIIFCMIVLVTAFSVSACAGVDADLKGDKMVVGLSPDFAPFEYRNGEQIVGFDVDLIKEIGKRMEVEVEIVAMDFDGIIAAVRTGNIDASISGLTITLDRAKNVLFSDPYASNRQVIVVRADDTRFANITTIEALEEVIADKKIGACMGYVGATVAEWYTDSNNITTYANITLANNALTNQLIDLYIMDMGAASAAVANNSALSVVDISLVDEEYGIIVNLKRTTLIARINEQLRALRREGFIDQLKEQHNIE